MTRSLSLALILAPVLGACSPFAVDAYLDENVNTLVHLEWTTDSDAVSWVEYGIDGEYDLVTPMDEGGTEHHFALLGTPGLSEVSYRAISEIDGKQKVAKGKLDTLGVPAAYPDFIVNTYDPERASADEYVLGTAFGGPQPCVYLIDREGNWLWYTGVEEEKNPIEINFERGSNNILYNSFLIDHGEDDSKVTRVSFDGLVHEDIRTPLGHHAFTELSDGSIAYLAIDVRDYDMDGDGEEVPVVGDAIVIVPADGGEPYPFWSVWDEGFSYEPAWHDRWDSAFYPQGGDWTHANSLHYYEATDTFLVSFRNLDMIAEIDATSGEVLREFGGLHGYQLTEGSRSFNYQHDVGWTAEGNLLMITTDDEINETTAVEYAVDDGAQTLDEVWSHGDGERIYVLVQGTARDLENGNRLVNFGSAGLIREVTLEGDVVWELEARAGYAFGNSVPFTDLWNPGTAE
jgi:hypothetical protein